MVEAGGGQAEGIPVKPSTLPAANAKTKPIWKNNGKVNWFKRALFFDVDNLIYHGYQTRLEPEDMYSEPAVSTKNLIERLDSSWQEQLKKPKPDLKLALVRGNVGLIVFTGFLYGISQACSLAGPLLLRRIVTGLQCESMQRKSRSGVDFGCDPRSKLYL